MLYFLDLPSRADCTQASPPLLPPLTQKSSMVANMANWTTPTSAILNCQGCEIYEWIFDRNRRQHIVLVKGRKISGRSYIPLF